jgi:hypothetical protein
VATWREGSVGIVITALAIVGTCWWGAGELSSRLIASALLLGSAGLLTRLFGARFVLHLALLMIPLTTVANLTLVAVARSAARANRVAVP